ncbi:DUF58 domain-containing protein [Natrinema gari]|uniref:DUF58 domain-containing protein n=1 Tax=Natrinema gari JCM 14663 TaxID=1230459 RepID=L9YYR6_9EURY|nr:DUF58 domain-containing protein [Natrinema gari]ELY78043.1 hypothetical protein C486_14287 [Natrinema gari JCM 14663]
MTDRTVDRVADSDWAVAATVALAGLGITVGSQLLVAAATLPLWYVAADVLGSDRSALVRVRRRVTVHDASSEGVDADEASRSDEGEEQITASPGATATVRTTVRNDGSETLVDLRVVDGVPDALPVVSGSPRACETLEPLETATLEYEVELRRGEHAFGDATVRTRDLTGTITDTWTAGVEGDDAVHCSPPVETVPPGDGTNEYAGEVPTDEGGSGLEFYAVREYEPGDPVRAIDWRRYAGTRELATVEYRAERSTRIVCIVDARPNQFRAATTDRVPAIERSADAAGRAFERLVAAGHPTGIVGIHEQGLTSVPPGTGPATRQEATDLLDAMRVPGYVAAARSQTGDPSTALLRSLPGDAQVYLFSSFVDDDPLELVEALRARGYGVRVVAPDVTADTADTATRLAALERGTRLARARATGARVLDWDRERPLGAVLRTVGGEVATR